MESELSTIIGLAVVIAGLIVFFFTRDRKPKQTVVKAYRTYPSNDRGGRANVNSSGDYSPVTYIDHGADFGGGCSSGGSDGGGSCGGGGGD
jgi:uncharacterized membrane protein YgcG